MGAIFQKLPVTALEVIKVAGSNETLRRDGGRIEVTEVQTESADVRGWRGSGGVVIEARGHDCVVGLDGR